MSYKKKLAKEQKEHAIDNACGDVAFNTMEKRALVAESLAREQAKELAEWRETFKDAKGNVWVRPTAEAYYRVCVLKDTQYKTIKDMEGRIAAALVMVNLEPNLSIRNTLRATLEGKK